MRVASTDGENRRIAGLVATTLLIVAGAVACSSHSPGKPVESSPSTEAIEATSLPTPFPLPAGPIAFKICGTTDWTKPTLAEMRDVFAVPRFGNGSTLFVGNYALYLSSFYFIVEPNAISVNIEPGAMSGIAHALPDQQPPDPNPSQVCYPDPAQDWNALFQDVWLADHRAIAVRAEGSTIVVRAAPAPRTFQRIELPDPPVPRVGLPTKGDGLFLALRVEDANGSTLYSNGRDGIIGYDDSGRLQFAEGSLTSDLRFEIKGEAAKISVIGQSIEALGGTLVINDESGKVILTAEGAGPKDAWNLLRSLTVPPGRYSLRFESRGSQFGGILVLPADTPWP